MILDDKLMKYVLFSRRTTAEVREKCKTLNFDEEYIEEVLEYLQENGYLDDDLYVSKYMKNVKKLKKKSVQEIRFDLLRRGIEESIIEKYIDEELRVYEYMCAIELAKKKYIENKDMLKTKKYLAGKGYPSEVIRRATDWLKKLEMEKGIEKF